MPQDSKKPPFEKIFFMLAGAVLGIFTIAVLTGIGLFRSEIREQILKRDGIILKNVAQYLYAESDPSGIAEWDLLELALDSSQIEGVIAVRVFSPLDTLIEQVPSTLYAVGISELDQAALDESQPVIRYFPEFHLDTLFSDVDEIGEAGTSPLVEVIAPLARENGEVNAAIQYWLDGSAAAAEFALLDRYLISMGAVFILGGAVIFSIVFLYARKRLIGMARLLSDRNESLRKANAELMLAARTSAVGSITSHLFHGLKNPLAGLKAYLKVSAHDEEAIAIADRMQSLINETLEVIREDNGSVDNLVSMDDLADMARDRLASNGRGETIPVRISAEGNASISAKKVQLLLLILRNLVDNAVEASPEQESVRVELVTDGEDLRVNVIDKGNGIPKTVKDRLFEPVTSPKSTGTGIGLAISAVLARHIPASLELVRSDREGTEFSLVIPL